MPVEPNVRARRHTLPAAYPRIGRFAAQRATWWSTAGTSPLGRPDRVAGLTTPADYEQVTARGHTMLLDTRFGSPDDAAAPDRHDGSPRCAPSSSRAIPPSARSSSDDPTLPVPPCPRVFSPRQLVPAGAAWDFRHHTDQGATMNRRRRGRSSEHRRATTHLAEMAPEHRDLFRYDGGPVSYRGRLNGTANVLGIASNPGPTERLVGRTLLWDAGQRVQGGGHHRLRRRRSGRPSALGNRTRYPHRPDPPLNRSGSATTTGDAPTQPATTTPSNEPPTPTTPRPGKRPTPRLPAGRPHRLMHDSPWLPPIRWRATNRSSQ
jgi:hypothetical protein